jgi:hypothetical protein
MVCNCLVGLRALQRCGNAWHSSGWHGKQHVTHVVCLQLLPGTWWVCCGPRSHVLVKGAPAWVCCHIAGHGYSVSCSLQHCL